MRGEYRKIYEFSPQTKKEALIRAENRCDHCGKETKELSIHHFISIWWAIETKCLAVEVIKSLQNASALCRDCHSETHKQESRAFYEEIAPIVLASYLSTKIDYTKDRWRYEKPYANDPRTSQRAHQGHS